MDGRRSRASGREGEVTRTVRLDAARLADALVGWRREMTGHDQRYHLGDHGTFELDARVAATDDGPTFTGRLWSPDGGSVRPCEITTACDAGATTVTLRSASAATGWFATTPAAARDLARASLDEVCEELLFHAASERRAREHA